MKGHLIPTTVSRFCDQVLGKERNVCIWLQVQPCRLHRLQANKFPGYPVCASVAYPCICSSCSPSWVRSSPNLPPQGRSITFSLWPGRPAKMLPWQRFWGLHLILVMLVEQFLIFQFNVRASKHPFRSTQFNDVHAGLIQ